MGKCVNGSGGPPFIPTLMVFLPCLNAHLPWTMVYLPWAIAYLPWPKPARRFYGNYRYFTMDDRIFAISHGKTAIMELLPSEVLTQGPWYNYHEPWLFYHDS